MFSHLETGRYQRLLLKNNLPALQRSALSGTARSLSFSHGPRGDLGRAHGFIVAEMLSPFVFLYVWWVLQKSRERGVDVLFFLARDGLLLKKVADVLIESWGLTLETKDLYCSRESLMLASVSSVDDFVLKWMLWGFRNEMSFTELSRRVKVEPAQLATLFDDRALSDYTRAPDRLIVKEDIPKIESVLRSEPFAQVVIDSSREGFELVRDYLTQEGVGGMSRQAVVDTGWFASSQYAISSILDKAGSYPPGGLDGFYLGVNAGAWCYGADRVSGFLYDYCRQKRLQKPLHHLSVEMLFSANEGRVVGYDRLGGEVVPVQALLPSGYAADLVDRQHDMVVEYARRICRTLDFKQFKEGAARQLSRRLLRRFSMDPSLEEAELFGSWPMACEIGEQDCQEMAPVMTFSRFVSVLLGREKVEGFWPQASLVRGGCGWLSKLYSLAFDLNLVALYRRLFLRY